MSEGGVYVVIYEPPKPDPGYATSEQGQHMMISHAINAQDAVRQAVESRDHWARGSLWAIPFDNLQRIYVKKRYDYAVSET